MQNSSKGNNSWKNHRTRTRRWYAHPPSILNIPMKFQWNPTSSFREFAWTRTVPYIFMQNSSKGNNSWKNHRTRTRMWYAHPPLILNIPMKFHWNPTSSFREFAWTRAGRTHGRTDARTHGRTDARTKRRLYAPPKFFGEHKNNVEKEGNRYKTKTTGASLTLYTRVKKQHTTFWHISYFCPENKLWHVM